MINTYKSGVLGDAASWSALRATLGGSTKPSLLNGVLNRLRDAGGVYYILESAYVDRDFAKAYAAFYYRTHHPHRKYCRRLHVFGKDLSAIESLETSELADALQAEGAGNYVGCVVLRPLAHAPVSWAVVAHADRKDSELLVRSTFTFHVMGAEFSVIGMPVTEQDSRTGACAQAAIWSAARHFHNKVGLPWHSIVDITAAALTPTDAENFRSLPAGSEYLTTDGMVRAMKAIGLHPFVYEPDDDGTWFDEPRRIICRYLDSGIPVIVGLQSDEDGQPHSHAVVAVGIAGRRLPADADEAAFAKELPGGGTEQKASGGEDTSASVSQPQRRDKVPMGPTAAELHTHILVNDDQRGCYRALPTLDAYKRSGETFSLANATFVMPSLPDSVFLSAEAAEALARQRITDVVNNRSSYVKRASGQPKAPPPVDAAFYANAAKLMTRTYLTQGWKYQSRMLRNRISKEFKNELMRINLPKYVWVTEFAFPEDMIDADPCNRRVRAHVVIDSTGSDFWESTIFTHVPGLLMTNAFDPYAADTQPELLMYASTNDEPYLPKVRGQSNP